jgi:thymidylate synthase (FAD)
MGFTESEESRRYIKSTPILYMPDEFHSIPDNVKQGAGEVHPESKKWLDIYKNRCAGAIVDYELMIADGVAPEEARFILPQGVEVHWIWTGNLASYARYYNQRTDPHAQLASQQLARDVGKIIAPYFPVSWHALTTSGRTE